MIDLYEFAWVTVLAVCAALALGAIAYARPRLALAMSYLLVAIAGTKFRVREATDSVTIEADWQILLELALYGVVALLVTMSVVSGRIPRRRLAPVELLLVGFVVLALCSTFWSVAPSLTAVRALQMMLVCGLALTSVRLFGPIDALRVASGMLVAYVLVGAASSAVFGTRIELFEEASFRFTWFAVHPLTAGTWAAEASVLMLARSLFAKHRAPDRPWSFRALLPWIVLLALFVVLLFTNTRGPLLAFLAATGLLLWKTMRNGLARGVVAAATVFVLIVALSDWSISDSLPVSPGSGEEQGFLAERVFRGGDMDTLRTLNGRLEVWEAAMPLIAEKPLLGYGYHGARTFMFTRVYWASYAHNAYVQSLLDFGIIGAFLVWGALGAIFLRLLVRPLGTVTGSAWCDASMIGILAFLLVSSVSSESVIASPGYEALLMFAAASIVGQYGSPGLRALQRSGTTTTIGPGLRVARQGGYAAYRHL